MLMKMAVKIVPLCLSLALAAVSPAQPRAAAVGDSKIPVITTFHVRGSQGTVPQSINVVGTIAGYYLNMGLTHGFVRATNGTITTFDAPGSIFTNGYSINAAGTITGFYGDSSVVYQGFVRAKDGTITSFDAPGAGTGYGEGTLGFSINAAGVIAGYYWDASGVRHGFVRSK